MTRNAPTTREELAAHLDVLGVRHDCYDLFGGGGRLLNDAQVLDLRPEGWVVFYTDRGCEYSLIAFQHEAAACKELLERVTRDEHCFFQLVAGPAPQREADEAWTAWLRARRISASDLEQSEWKTDDVPWVAGPYWRRYFVRTTSARRLDDGLAPSASER